MHVTCSSYKLSLFCVDRFVLNLALAEDAIVVSNDQFRDLYTEAKYKDLIEKR